VSGSPSVDEVAVGGLDLVAGRSCLERVDRPVVGEDPYEQVRCRESRLQPHRAQQDREGVAECAGRDAAAAERVGLSGEGGERLGLPGFGRPGLGRGGVQRVPGGRDPRVGFGQPAGRVRVVDTESAGQARPVGAQFDQLLAGHRRGLPCSSGRLDGRPGRFPSRGGVAHRRSISRAWTPMSTGA
jgi:hypothetical protein